MPKKTAADNVWPARPFDSKCRSTVPVDDDTVEQIRAIIDEWDADDWPTVRAVLQVEVPGVSSLLSKLTVRDVRQYFSAIANRGLGQRHTASTTVVRFDMPQTTGLAEDVAWYQAECGDYQEGAILAALLARGCTNKSRAATKAEIGLAVGDGKSKVDLQRPFGRLIKKGIVETAPSVGVWLSWRGERLAEYLNSRKPAR